MPVDKKVHYSTVISRDYIAFTSRNVFQQKGANKIPMVYDDSRFIFHSYMTGEWFDQMEVGLLAV